MAIDPAGALQAVWRFCADRDWSGWDPYDGLMATRFPFTLALGSRIGRLALIQGMKRSPLNLRTAAGVPTLKNPKGVALGLLAATRIVGSHRPAALATSARAEGQRLIEWLLRNSSRTPHGHGWGYPFDWQARAFYIRRSVPTVVCSGFVVRALDDATRGPFSSSSAAVTAALAKAAAFVEHDLQRSDFREGFCFSYSPGDRSVVVNATLLGAETMARAARRLGDRSLLDRALPTVRWSLAQRHERGGWAYGAAGHHRWEDAFHTGFNLMSLAAIRDCCFDLGGDPESIVSRDSLLDSYRHYAATFFDPDGRPWYFSHTPWPIDPHAAAVAILTHLKFAADEPEALERAERTARWTVAQLWNDRGWFDFQLTRWVRYRIPYLRWTQAWMLHALAELEAAQG